MPTATMTSRWVSPKKPTVEVTVSAPTTTRRGTVSGGGGRHAQGDAPQHTEGLVTLDRARLDADDGEADSEAAQRHGHRDRERAAPSPLLEPGQGDGRHPIAPPSDGVGGLSYGTCAPGGDGRSVLSKRVVLIRRDRRPGPATHEPRRSP
jgi:hypothetical protein